MAENAADLPGCGLADDAVTHLGNNEFVIHQLAAQLPSSSFLISRVLHLLVLAALRPF
jgi:hypothetical protein